MAIFKMVWTSHMRLSEIQFFCQCSIVHFTNNIYNSIPVSLVLLQINSKLETKCLNPSWPSCSSDLLRPDLIRSNPIHSLWHIATVNLSKLMRTSLYFVFIELLAVWNYLLIKTHKFISMFTLYNMTIRLKQTYLFIEVQEHCI